jgi:hypothetical protein
MAKKKTTVQYKDRKYNYPKGFTKYGKAKTGFMPAAQGARVFVEANLEKIQKGTIPYDSLTQREKRVYRGKTSNTFANTFTFKDKKYYDPTGFLRKALDNDPALKGKRDLTNLLPEAGFKDYFDQRINPTKGTKKLTDKERSKWLEFSSSFYDFNKGEKKQFYRDESGSLMDIVTKLNKARKQGREVRVIDTDGSIKVGVKAIERMREFEAEKLKEFTDKATPGQNIQLQIIYISTDWNPYTNTVTFNLNNVQVNDLNNTP